MNATQASIKTVLDAYFELKDALVEADTLAASNASLKLAAIKRQYQHRGNYGFLTHKYHSKFIRQHIF
jgi:hypothetical protein